MYLWCTISNATQSVAYHSNTIRLRLIKHPHHVNIWGSMRTDSRILNLSTSCPSQSTPHEKCLWYPVQRRLVQHRNEIRSRPHNGLSELCGTQVSAGVSTAHSQHIHQNCLLLFVKHQSNDTAAYAVVGWVGALCTRHTD
jgi:hypothetical protein